MDISSLETGLQTTAILNDISKINRQEPNIQLNRNELSISESLNFDAVNTLEQNGIFFEKKGLKVFHLNIHCLYPKFDEVKYLLSQQQDIDILCFCETFLNESFLDLEIMLTGYQMFRKDRKTHGGGIIVYVKNCYTCTNRNEIENDNTESLWLEIKYMKQKSFLFGYVYRPPSSLSNWVNDMERTLELIYSENKEILLLGDLNYNFVNNQSINSTWNSVYSSYNLKQLVNQPTRVTSCSSSIIDHLYTNMPCNIAEVTVPILTLSDHYPVCFTRKLTSKPEKGLLHNSISYRNLKHFNEEQFLVHLQHQPWSAIDTYNDVDDALECFIQMFSDVLNEHAPVKVRRVKHKHQPDWFTPEIANAIKKRDAAKLSGNKWYFRRCRNQVKTLISNAKTTFYEKTINKNNNNPKLLWKNLKDLSGKSKSHQANFITNEDGNQISDPLETAEIFNKFFTEIFKTAPLVDGILQSQNKSVLQNYVDSKMQDNDLFQIPFISESFVMKELNSLDSTKSTGLDGLGPRFLKVSSNIIARPLTHIFNLGIRQTKFPNIFKVAKVTPIFKKGVKNDKNNYRPISILPVLSKVYERHISNSLKLFLEKHKLLNNQQSGFRKFHSCETALTQIVDNWIEAINNNNLVGTIFLDLTKAFDLINHSLLIEKLKCYRFCSKSIKWFTSYLTGRYQKVSISGKLSCSREISAGVPQGSVLGPLLFIIYINDLPLFVKDTIIDMFADDTTITAVGKSKPDITQTLQNEICIIENWCQQNSMLPNVQKTKTMFLAASYPINHQSDEIKILLQNHEIQQTYKEKILGVHIDPQLNWKHHVEHTLKKCNSLLYLLLRIKKFLNIHSRNLFFNAYILPHIDYCCTIWGSCSQNLLDKMLKFQKRAARVILDKPFDAPSEELFQQLSWMKFHARIDYKKAIIIYKSLNEQCPEYLRDKFKYSQNKGLRSFDNKLLQLPKPKLEFFRKSLTYSGPKIWNDIPFQIRTADSLNSFKKLYLAWMFTSSS